MNKKDIGICTKCGRRFVKSGQYSTMCHDCKKKRWSEAAKKRVAERQRGKEVK